MAEHSNPSPYEQGESRAAHALEQLVAKPSFGVLLAQTAENIAAITRIGSDLADLVLRNLRIAGRADITRLARQLHRTETKLERVLQEVEHLNDELARTSMARTPVPRAPVAASSARGAKANGARLEQPKAAAS
jgi:hypothetical protein